MSKGRTSLALLGMVLSLSVMPSCATGGSVDRCTTTRECGAEEVCLDGLCQPAEPRDGGASDADGAEPPPDGSPGTDGGGSCRPERCDDGIVCTTDRCAGGECVNEADDSVCTAASGGHCDPELGCQYDTCTPEVCTAGPCQTARCEGDTCVRESTCGGGTTCCADSCVPAGCDDGIPCTDDVCGATGCEHIPNDAACDDGNPCTQDVCDATDGCSGSPRSGSCDDGSFCNGADSCSDGACTVHAGDPCSGDSTCDETMEACVGCVTDGDCPDDGTDPWGTCTGFDGTCDETGTQSRTVRTYECGSDGTCVESTSTETRECTREREGVSCGSSSCGSWSACDYDSACDEEATRTRPCTDLTCSSGSCVESSRTETDSCTRDTDGDSCASGCGSCVSGSCNAGGSSGWTALGGALSAATGDTTATAPSITLDGCAPVVAWSEPTSSGASAQVQVRRWTGSTWESLGGALSAGGDPVVHPAVDASGGEIVLSWAEAGSVYTRRWTGSGWTSVGGGFGSGSSAFQTDLATRGASDHAVAFNELSSCGTTCFQIDVRVFGWDGSSWSSLGSRFEDSFGHALDRTSDADPVLTVLSGGTLELRRWTGSSWTSFAGGSVPRASSATGPDLVLDASDEPAVAWISSGAINVDRRSGGTWTTLAAGLSAAAGNAAFKPRLAIDGADRVVVVWPEQDGSGSSEVYVRRQSGGSLVALGTGMLDATSGAGNGPWLAVDGIDRPVVAWSEGSPASIQVWRYSD